jgi:hypothetical protein
MTPPRVSFRAVSDLMIQVVVFWKMTSCSDVDGYHCFGGLFCGHLQSEVIEVQVTLKVTVGRPVSHSVSQSVRLGVEPLLGLMTIFSSFMSGDFGFICHGTSCQMKGRVCLSSVRCRSHCQVFVSIYILHTLYFLFTSNLNHFTLKIEAA